MRNALTLLVVLVTTPALAQIAEPEVSIRYSLAGEHPGDGYGWAAEVIGDLDGDGAAEYVVGAPQAFGLSGRAYVHSGATGAVLETLVGGPFSRLGFGVAGIGDASGDGVPDYAVSAPGVIGGPAGRVFLVSGATHQVVWSTAGAADAFFGFDINAAGDVNDDGRPDVIVGANRDSTLAPVGGGVTILSGRDGQVIWSRHLAVPFAFFGCGVSGVDDLDGDGVPEQVAAAFRAGSHAQGRAYVFSGKSGALIRELTPSGTGVNFGLFFVHDAGDVDGDGTGDIYIGDVADGARNASSHVAVQGRGYVYSGRSGERLRTINGENPGDGMGIGRGAGDLDGDGHADLIVAAWLESSAAVQGGKVYLISGKNGQTLRTMTGTVAFAQLGFNAIALGDVSGDGVTDFLITGNGVAHVVHGI